jgi:hypothetical protein
MSSQDVRPDDAEATADVKPWSRYAGMVESGGPFSSLGIDEIEYGVAN